MAPSNPSSTSKKAIKNNQTASSSHVVVQNGTGLPRHSRSMRSTTKVKTLVSKTKAARALAKKGHKDQEGHSFSTTQITIDLVSSKSSTITSDHVDNGSSFPKFETQEAVSQRLTSSTTADTADSKAKVVEDDGTNSNNTQVGNAAAPATCFILKVTTELLIHIMKYFNLVQSTCLGLTCKTLYSLHFDQHGKVALYNYVSVKGHPSLSSTYTRDGTTLANYLTTWVPSHLKYNYQKHRFVTKKRFMRFIEVVRDDEAQQIWADATMMFEGLDDDDYEDMTDRYMEEADCMGWEYEDRPSLEPTSGQIERSKRWRRKNRNTRT